MASLCGLCTGGGPTATPTPTQVPVGHVGAVQQLGGVEVVAGGQDHQIAVRDGAARWGRWAGRQAGRQATGHAERQGSATPGEAAVRRRTGCGWPLSRYSSPHCQQSAAAAPAAHSQAPPVYAAAVALLLANQALQQADVVVRRKVLGCVLFMLCLLSPEPAGRDEEGAELACARARQHAGEPADYTPLTFPSMLQWPCERSQGTAPGAAAAAQGTWSG